MEGNAIIKLTDSFEFQGKYSSYTVLFLDTHINIADESTSKDLDYSEVSKIKYTEKSIKLILRSPPDKIKIQCSTSDIKQIKTLFKSISTGSSRDWEATSHVEFGNLKFFVIINSNNYQELKTKIIQKIARFFYPACAHDQIFYDKFKKFKISVKMAETDNIEIENTEDLEAVLRYFNGRLDISILPPKE